MRIDIKDERKNPFMKRKEVSIEIENPEEATPSKASIQKAVSEKMGKGVESIEVIEISQGKGVSKAKAYINVWDEKKVADLSKKEAPKTE